MLIVADGIAEGYPRDISGLGLPNDLDASINPPAQYQYFRINGRWYRRQTVGERVYFFKGSQVWKFMAGGPAAGYPKPISEEFPGLPNDLDAAFVWSGNNRYYFFKGGEYYRVSNLASGVDQGYPRPISAWRLPVSSIDAALKYANGRTYFFSGSQYYRYNDNYGQVDSSYPRPINTWWLGCPDSNLKMAEHMEMTLKVDEEVGVVMNTELRGETIEKMSAELMNAEDLPDDFDLDTLEGNSDDATYSGGQGALASAPMTSFLTVVFTLVLSARL